MPQPSAAPADQLQRRSSELDAREAYLEAREQLAEQTEAAITKGQHELALLDATILAREVIVNEQQDRMLLLDKEYVRKQTLLEHAVLKKQEQYAKWELKLTELQTTASAAKASIADRLDYYKEQEKLIAKQAEEGNLQLRGLEYELLEIKQTIKDLEITKQNLYSEQKNLEHDLEVARDSFASELEHHEMDIAAILKRKADAEAEVLAIRTKARDAYKEVNELNIKRQQMHDDVDAKLQILDTKEREIMAKREALRQEREEMDTTKHYYQDPKSLYGTI
jgi:uncharacterized protein (DUF3084 family)